MPQPAGDLYKEIMDTSGQKRAILGRDKRGYIDVFIYIEKQDKLFQLKLESIRPCLKKGCYGYQLVGFGDEVSEYEEIVERIMDKGFIIGRPEDALEKIRKLGKVDAVIGVGVIAPEDGINVFSSPPPLVPHLHEAITDCIPKNKVDRRLTEKLEKELARNQLGSSSYIA